jgi:hypothetical protein
MLDAKLAKLNGMMDTELADFASILHKFRWEPRPAVDLQSSDFSKV